MRLSDFRWLIPVCLFAACSTESPPDSTAPNQAPSVWVQAQPPVGSDNSYSVHFEWGGSDPDGKVSHYEFIIADNGDVMLDPAHIEGAWTTVYGDDSTFVFQVDPTHTTESESHVATFLIRAVDNEMLPSEEPDYISFTPKSLAPGVRITVPPAFLLNPANVTSISTFEWSDNAPQPEPDSVQFAMVSTNEHGGSFPQTIAYLRDLASAPDWYPWVWYDAPAGKGKVWTTPPLEFGNYVFAIRAKNVAGAMNPVLQEPVNVRRIRVQPLGATGPLLAVQNPLIGRILATTCQNPLTIADIAAHLPLSFTLTACANAYGGVVTGYRYGWDILDPNDPAQWEMDYAPYLASPVFIPPRAFSFGTHTFSAEVIDNLGQCSRIEVKINIVRFTGARNLLIVDDYLADEVAGQSGWAVTNGAIPNDAEHDAFWLDMASNVDQFDPAIDMITVYSNSELPFATIASYKAVVWSVFSDVAIRNGADLPLLYQFIQYRSTRVHKSHNPDPCPETGSGASGNVTTDFVAQAMQAGIHVLITGNHPVQDVVPRYGTFQVRWPMIPLYELEPGSTQTGTEPTFFDDPPGALGFAYRELCLESIDFAYLTTARARLTGSPPNQRYCSITGLRVPNAQSRRDDTMRSGVPIDPNFPPISLRPEAAAPGRFYQASNVGYDVEVYNPVYFRQGVACAFVPPPRSCFEPIYGLDCLDTAELTYHQPVAFWTGAFANVVAEDIPGAVAARSAVFGFPPVYFNPSEIKPGIEYILFDEWQLPRRP
jgi:hypothetical protein